MIEIVKDDDVVATADSFVTLDMPGLDGIKKLELFFFRRIKLSPIATFAHLAGEALIRFLDGAHIRGAESRGPVRYIHGRSEVMKGKHTVSAVLLAIPEFSREFSVSEWLSVVPEIYRRYLANQPVQDLKTNKQDHT